MKIVSKSGRVYDVRMKEHGWSYARASVRVKKKFLFWEYFSEVWDENPYAPVYITFARTASKAWATKWFEDTVEMYEDYQRDWERELV